MATDPYWNHNTHYHPWLLDQVPAHARTALDIGCGDGLLARKLATRCDAVLGIDIDSEVIANAPSTPHVHLDKADFRDLDDTFDMVTAVATLHHVPVREGMAAVRDLVAPGGTLAVVGLWKMHPLNDIGYLPLLPVVWATDRRHRRRAGGPNATIRDPEETLGEIRRAAEEFLPGAQIRRRLLWRYTLLWQRPR
ncbi:class I SAM-dependent methyltransferase [Nocardia ignorata]|uniref:Methyltransferase family protein n=1 Tax=Nocardia ignorata TaxID=145285 RepID=A0A4R6PUB6_NOCIG|nr:class I SAM-dependent methyltransferase [Nocardia ignorata]TDP40916.1 methyltransferase family protein [Nocardia ignorata]